MNKPRSFYADPKTLKPNPWNSNIVTPENLLKLENSIQKFGVYKPVIVRELEDGSLEILGGQHRSQVAASLGVPEVPVVSLGPLDEVTAKQIGLVDNGRYGDDDVLKLSEILKDIGDIDEIMSWMPLDQEDMTAIFNADNLAFDDLELSDADELPSLDGNTADQTHQLMRFKVPLEDAARISELIERVMKKQGFTEEDELSNAGNALVHLLLVRGSD